MTIWFLIVVSCASPGDPATCRNHGPPVMSFETGLECRTVVLEALRFAAKEGKQVAYACERGAAM